MYHKRNNDLLLFARNLRKEMTAEERKLWYQFLRDYPVPFRRQEIIGNFIADFYCSQARLVIELDGSQHYEDTAQENDRKRTAFLNDQGIAVLRIPNHEVKRHFEEVCVFIDEAVKKALREDPSVGFADSSPVSGADKEKNMKTVEIYTDGACSGNPGPGGWGAILRYNGREKCLSGGEAMTTNNRMELTGVIQAMLALKEPCVVELWSDSKYVIDGLQKGWAKGWRKKGWIKSDKKPALNPDLWALLLDLTRQHEMRYHWVKGHADNEYNNRCDALAVAARERFT